MHDTAFTIGGLAIEHYCPSSDGEILEIGSLDVNGSLRRHNINCKRYIGLDFSPGEGVDHVIADDYDWPVEDASFDLVLASSVFEHDATFWQTFVVMARKVRPGGYIYVNAPANGWIHRYPLDCWRFYPNSGVALARWAEAQGTPVTLVESFMAQRRADVWNDWCGVFRREPAVADLPERLISDQLDCTNVITWKSPDISRHDEQPEDMHIIDRERAARIQAEQRLDRVSAESVTEAEALQMEIAQLQQLAIDAQATHAALEVARAEALALAARAEQSANQAAESLTLVTGRAADLEARLDRSEGLVRLLENRLKAVHAERDAMASDLSQSIRDKRAISDRLRFATLELSEMARLVRTSLANQAQEAAGRAWMGNLLAVIRKSPAWWALLPPRMRQARLKARLHERGLFDADGYLQRYPDVAQAGLDPLEHYLAHGQYEGRIATGQEPSA